MPPLAGAGEGDARSRGGLSSRRLVPLLPLVLGTAALVLVWGRFTLEARRAVRDAGVAVSGGDRAEAVRCYLDALRMYVPGSPYQRQALDGLDQLAARAREAAEPAAEREALDAIRAGLLGARGVVIPHRARLVAAQNRLYELDHGAGDGQSPAAPANPHRRAPGPTSAVLSTLIALVGLATWIAAVALLVRSGLEDRGPPSAPGSLPPAPSRSRLRFLVPALFAVGAVLFLAGLRFA